MTSYIVPVHATAGAPGFLAAFDQIVDDLTLISGVAPAVTGGLTGVVAAARWAGATSTGSPASGTFTTGDFVTTLDGAMWICTAGGSPGTWAQVGAGGGGAMTNPMTTTGDLIKGGAGGTPARIGIGSAGQALVVSAGAPAWGSVGIAGGGTGQATQQAALDALAGAVTNNQVLAGNGTHVTLRALAAADIPQLADYAPTGLTGATSATRYVGATASGAPGSGTFVTGDFITTLDGHIFVCTTGGTPGTWANAGASAGVSTFNSRSGAVVPANADYLAVASGGLTGATTATRYAGGTTSGAPASGTFSTGDFTVDVSGDMWVCTSGGSPGTWVRLRSGTLNGYLAPAVVALTDASTIAVNAALGNDLRVTIGASRTMGVPSNAVDGQRIDFMITQGGAGSFTITWSSSTGGYSFGAGSAPTLTTTTGKTDIIGFAYNATLSKWLYLGSSLGF